MIKNIGILAVFLAFVFTCPHANADWRDVKFGDTLSSVEKHDPGSVEISHDPSDQSQYSIMSGDMILLHHDGYDIDGMKFDVRYSFDQNNKLNSIMLYGDGSYYNRALMLLSGKYGQPASANFGHLPQATWADPAKKTQIKLMRIFGTIIRYSPQSDRL